jgi:hypothetical protein
MATLRVVQGDDVKLARGGDSESATDRELSARGEVRSRAHDPTLESAQGSPAAATVPRSRRLTLQQLDAHLWGAANILRGRTAGQDYKNYILTLMFYKRLCDQWTCEVDEAITEIEQRTGRPLSEAQKSVLRVRNRHRFTIPPGAHWGDVMADAVTTGETLTKAMRAVAYAGLRQVPDDDLRRQ